MDFLDSATGTGPQHPETAVGRAQTEKGVSEMSAGKHGAPATGNTAMHGHTGTMGTTGTGMTGAGTGTGTTDAAGTTGAVPPPLPQRGHGL